MKPVSDGGERHVALAQFTKHPVAYRSEIIPAICTSLPGDLRLAVLEMNMPDTLTETVQPVLDVPAIIAAGTIEVVAGIEHQPQQVRIGHVQETSDLSPRFDIPGTIMIRRRLQPSRITPRNANTLTITINRSPFRL